MVGSTWSSCSRRLRSSSLVAAARRLTAEAMRSQWESFRPNEPHETAELEMSPPDIASCGKLLICKQVVRVEKLSGSPAAAESR